MSTSKDATVDTFENLRLRVDRFFRAASKRSQKLTQLSLNIPSTEGASAEPFSASHDIGDFIDFLSDAMPDGNIYLFGGLLRDIALLGKKGFSSDIDLVVEGDWDSFITYLESLGAKKNKFGGYRLQVKNWPVDIWSAKETWAIKQGFIAYKGIASLTETTILNWDAILMNWRTKSFIAPDGYLKSLQDRKLDIVLKENPNPRGMAVRVFRHLCMKDAKQITPRAAEYLLNCTERFSFKELQEGEFKSYGNLVIEFAIYRWFEALKESKNGDIFERNKIVSRILEEEGVSLSSRQTGLEF